MVLSMFLHTTHNANQSMQELAGSYSRRLKVIATFISLQQQSLGKLGPTTLSAGWACRPTVHIAHLQAR